MLWAGRRLSQLHLRNVGVCSALCCGFQASRWNDLLPSLLLGVGQQAESQGYDTEVCYMSHQVALGQPKSFVSGERG